MLKHAKHLWKKLQLCLCCIWPNVQVCFRFVLHYLSFLGKTRWVRISSSKRVQNHNNSIIFFYQLPLATTAYQIHKIPTSVNSKWYFSKKKMSIKYFDFTCYISIILPPPMHFPFSSSSPPKHPRMIFSCIMPNKRKHTMIPAAMNSILNMSFAHTRFTKSVNWPMIL